MLASLAEPFDSPEYTYEIKWDGYRALAFLDSNTRLQSRNLKDITGIFPDLSQIHSFIKQTGTVIDGEIIALRNGKPDFRELQKRGQLRNKSQILNALKSIPVTYIAFDLLYLNGQPLFQEPLETRRSLLADNLYPSTQLVLTDSIESKGIAYFNSIAAMGLEGVIAKKKNSVYSPGKRTKTWLKFKRRQRDPFIICGFVINPTSRGELSSLVLGAYLDGRLKYFGMVGTGFSRKELEITLKELQKIVSRSSPFTGSITPKLKDISWTKPLVVCEVEYLELTDDGSLRDPSFKRFRPDIKPAECIYPP